MIFPVKERKLIARIAAEEYLIAADLRRVPGPSKFARATAAGMRRLKEEGIPEAISGLLKSGIAGKEPDLGAISEIAGDSVDVIADAIEAGEGCECDRRVLAIIRSLLQASIQAVHYGIKSR